MRRWRFLGKLWQGIFNQSRLDSVGVSGGASSFFYYDAYNRLFTVNLPDASIGEMHRYYDGDDVVLERRAVFGTPRWARRADVVWASEAPL